MVRLWIFLQAMRVVAREFVDDSYTLHNAYRESCHLMDLQRQRRDAVD